MHVLSDLSIAIHLTSEKGKDRELCVKLQRSEATRILLRIANFILMDVISIMKQKNEESTTWFLTPQIRKGENAFQ